MDRVRRLLAAAATCVVLAGCAGGAEPEPGPGPTTPFASAVPTPTPTPTQAPDVVPGQDWDVQERGDFGEVDAAMAAAASTCLVVVEDGVVVHRATWAGTGQATTRPAYSITKSLTAVLVAMVVDDGDLTLDTPVADHVPAWRGTASEDVTVRQLMA